jgi:hypothetical protein
MEAARKFVNVICARRPSEADDLSVSKRQCITSIELPKLSTDAARRHAIEIRLPGRAARPQRHTWGRFWPQPSIQHLVPDAAPRAKRDAGHQATYATWLLR